MYLGPEEPPVFRVPYYDFLIYVLKKVGSVGFRVSGLEGASWVEGSFKGASRVEGAFLGFLGLLSNVIWDFAFCLQSVIRV